MNTRPKLRWQYRRKTKHSCCECNKNKWRQSSVLPPPEKGTLERQRWIAYHFCSLECSNSWNKQQQINQKRVNAEMNRMYPSRKKSMEDSNPSQTGEPQPGRE